MWPPPPDSVVIVLVGVLVFAAHMPLWQQVVRQGQSGRCPVCLGSAPAPAPALVHVRPREMSHDLVVAASHAMTTGRATVRALEAAGAYRWATDASWTILWTAGGGLRRYGVTSGQAVGTNMRDWPNADRWAFAVQRLQDNPDVDNVIIEGDGWIVPSLVTVARRPEGGGFIAIAVPQPAAEETPRAPSDN